MLCPRVYMEFMDVLMGTQHKALVFPSAATVGLARPRVARRDQVNAIAVPNANGLYPTVETMVVPIVELRSALAASRSTL